MELAIWNVTFASRLVSVLEIFLYELLISSNDKPASPSACSNESSVGPLAPFYNIPNAIETLNGEINTLLFASAVFTLENSLKPNELAVETTDFSSGVRFPPDRLSGATGFSFL